MESEIETASQIDHYKTIFENALEGIYQSSPEGKYLRVNPALARMYGYENPDELLNQVADIPHQIYVDPQKRLEFERRMEQENRVIGLEYQVRRKDGATLWISEAARAVRGSDGRLLYYEGFIQDISSRKKNEAIRARLEERLKNAQRLEAIGALARGVAHDFNNILAGIIGYTEIALDDPNIADNTSRYLEEILSGSRRARDLVSKMLYFSQQSFPKKESLSATEVVRRALQSAPAPNSIAIHIEEVGGLNAFPLECDPDQIKLVILHLLENSYDALKGSPGNIFIQFQQTTTPIQGQEIAEAPTEPGDNIDDSETKLWTQISIRDDGPGIHSDDLEHIFDPFFTTRPVGQGTGLGLSVCHGIIKSHGGFIQATSQPGEGATFVVSLPVNSATAESGNIDSHSFSKSQESFGEPSGSGELSFVDKPKPPQEPKVISGCDSESAQLDGKKVMIVDDEPALLSIMKRKLAALGAQISIYTDPEKALQIFRAAPLDFDIVITDYSMPKLTGTDLACELWACQPEIPIILCTGYADPLVKNTSGFTGKIERLMKPFDITDLSLAIQKLLSNGARLDLSPSLYKGA